MPRQCRSGPGGQQSESLIQAGKNQFRSEHCGTSRRKLDRERPALEAAADGSNRSKVLSLRREARIQRPPPGNEKLNRPMPKNATGFLLIPSGHIDETTDT